jgi:hypothetical protein
MFFFLQPHKIWKGIMFRIVSALFVLCIASSLVAQTSPSAKEQAAQVESVRTMALHAVNFKEGNLASLNASQANFTPDGWREFLNHMSGFLDDDGAPTFTSSFTPAGKAIVLKKENDTIHIRIPGALAQTHGQSTTNYRHAALDVTAGGDPLKIQHLQQVFMLQPPRS